ncbi:MAG: hypothetical protein ACLQBJ_07215 [Bryobacteraceae bacterium]
MKNKAFATLGLLTLLATVSAFGQSGPTANIPFEFHVGNTVMPAGQYEVLQNAYRMPDVLVLQCGAGKSLVTVSILTHKVGNYEARNEGKLVFNKYGETYFLSAVWPASGAGSALPTSKSERETTLRAALPPTTQVVLLARR